MKKKIDQKLAKETRVCWYCTTIPSIFWRVSSHSDIWLGFIVLHCHRRSTTLFWRKRLTEPTEGPGSSLEQISTPLTPVLSTHNMLLRNQSILTIMICLKPLDLDNIAFSTDCRKTPNIPPRLISALRIHLRIAQCKLDECGKKNRSFHTSWTHKPICVSVHFVFRNVSDNFIAFSTSGLCKKDTWVVERTNPFVFQFILDFRYVSDYVVAFSTSGLCRRHMSRGPYLKKTSTSVRQVKKLYFCKDILYETIAEVIEVTNK